MLAGRVEHLLHVLGEAELAQGLVDVVRRDGLLGLPFRDLVGLGRDERDELDAAVDQQVARVLAEDEPGLVAQDLRDDLLDGRCGGRRQLCCLRRGGAVEGRLVCSPFGSERSSFPDMAKHVMVVVVVVVFNLPPNSLSDILVREFPVIKRGVELKSR